MESHFQHSRNMEIGRPGSSIRVRISQPQAHLYFGDHFLFLRPTSVSVFLIPTTPCHSPWSSPCPSPISCPTLIAILIQTLIATLMQTQSPTEIAHGFNHPNRRRRSSPSSTVRLVAFLPKPHLPSPRNAHKPEPCHVIIKTRDGTFGSDDAKEPFRFAMDVEKVYAGANGPWVEYGEEGAVLCEGCIAACDTL